MIYSLSSLQWPPGPQALVVTGLAGRLEDWVAAAFVRQSWFESLHYLVEAERFAAIQSLPR